MKLHIPDKHLTISNILMFLTLFAVAGGGIGVLFQQVLMFVITVAVLGAFAMAIYAIVMTIAHSSGVVVSYDEPQRVEHVHHHYHRMIAEQPTQQPQQRLIEQQPTRYTVLPQQPPQLVLLPQTQHERIEVKR